MWTLSVWLNTCIIGGWVGLLAMPTLAICLYFFLLNWSIVDLQCYVNFWCTAKWFSYLLFSHSVMFDSLQLHGLQHARLPCLSPTPRACSNSCSLSRWCHPTISSSVVPFSSCLQSFPASGSFLMSQLFALGGQSPIQYSNAYMWNVERW